MSQTRTEKSLLPLDAADLQLFKYQLKTKAQSLSFGRRLYQCNAAEDVADEKQFWLKAQLTNSSGFSAEGFLQELRCYRIMHAQQMQIMLPFQIISNLHIQQGSEHLNFTEVLLLPHAPAFFQQDPLLLTLPQVKHWLWQAIDALDQLEQAGWMHGDIKTEHFVMYEGQLKILDFEQARQIIAPAHVMNATPRYMAPELFQGQPKDIVSEIYALGIVFYEWLSGQRLKASSYQDWAVLHCQQLKIELPAAFNAFLPLLLGMLAKHKTARMQSFLALKRCLITEIA